MALTMTGLPSSLPRGVDNRVVEPGVLLRALQAVGVGLEIGKLQGIGGDQVVVLGVVLAVVQQVGEPGAGVDAEVALAFGANVEILVEILLPDDLATLVAFDPETLGLDPLLARGIELTVFPLEPCHGC